MMKNILYHKKLLAIIIFTFVITDVNLAKPKNNKKSYSASSINGQRDSIFRKAIPFDIYVEKTSIDGLLWFAKQQLGTPYKYASANPKNGGLDCSGFLFYVFTHFNYKVPRSSKDYMSYGKTINKKDAQKGDVVVFTGTNASQRVGGHVGIILNNNNGDIEFIHGSSGKANGVTISKLSENYYSQRFLKVVRVVN